ncbi:MAG: transposase, partial [Acidobacteria bacterium]|nr:transposase [Acidobacteriota bacterium]MCI0719479.1 transposase [Acidobacteriota bacterium]
LLVSIPPTLPISKAVQLVKGGSSLWFHETFRRSAFAWQDGYGAFTVSKSQLPDIIRYVERQREHHRGQTFQESTGPFSRGMVSITTRGICGDESVRR